IRRHAVAAEVDSDAAVGVDRVSANGVAVESIREALDLDSRAEVVGHGVALARIDPTDRRAVSADDDAIQSVGDGEGPGRVGADEVPVNDGVDSVEDVDSDEVVPRSEVARPL